MLNLFFFCSCDRILLKNIKNISVVKYGFGSFFVVSIIIRRSKQSFFTELEFKFIIQKPCFPSTKFLIKKNNSLLIVINFIRKYTDKHTL